MVVRSPAARAPPWTSQPRLPQATISHRATRRLGVHGVRWRHSGGGKVGGRLIRFPGASPELIFPPPSPLSPHHGGQAGGRGHGGCLKTLKGHSLPCTRCKGAPTGPRSRRGRGTRRRASGTRRRGSSRDPEGHSASEVGVLEPDGSKSRRGRTTRRRASGTRPGEAPRDPEGAPPLGNVGVLEPRRVQSRDGVGRRDGASGTPQGGRDLKGHSERVRSVLEPRRIQGRDGVGRRDGARLGRGHGECLVTPKGTPTA